MTSPHPAEAVPQSNEIIRSREQFFENTVTLNTHDVLCGDKRPAIGMDSYIHLFGGGLNIPYNLAVLQEAAQPGSITAAFEAHVESVVPVMKSSGVRIAVHSDHNTEQGGQFRDGNLEGPVGCRYAEDRSVISGLIGTNGEGIITHSATLRPELFQDSAAFNFARAVVGAHDRLAKRPGFFNGGRSAVLTATGAGAKAVVVHGETDARAVGIINLDPESSIRSGAAFEAGLPAYVQDSWAAFDIADKVRKHYPHDQLQWQIAEAIDAVGTFHALDVEDIAVRR